MVPPAPRQVSLGVGALVIGDPGTLDMPLHDHGVRAVRRRYARGLTLAVLLAAVWAVLVLLQGWSSWLLLACVVPPAVAVPLAGDRARRLGHALTPDYLITRAHSLRGWRAVLLRDGIIGWNLHQTYFQRRAGLVTLTATTAAGKQGYRVYDVPEPVATMLADAAVPGLLTPFLVGTTAVDTMLVDTTAVDAAAVDAKDGV
jgi:putative membrane protein